MPRPKKSDAAKQAQPAPVAPAMVPLQMQPPQPLAIPPQQLGTPVAAGPPPPGVAPLAPTRTLDVEQFIRVRDSVHTRFTTLLSLMKNFSDDFLRQTNLLLGEPTSFDNGGGPSMSSLVTTLDGMAGQLGQLGDLVPQAEEKKERKKRTHDPNAPKRPLTPYFLYMQTARPIIANDLGQDAPKGAVQEEGQRRWAAMTPSEKTAWNNAYQFNLRLYNARVQSYKAGNPDARNMTDEEALTFADANGIPQPNLSGEEAIVPANDQDAIAEQLADAAAPVVPAPAAPAEDTKTPKGKGSRKRKSTVADADEGESTAAKTATPASPDKKRKRQSKVADTPSEEPKKSSRKKKA